LDFSPATPKLPAGMPALSQILTSHGCILVLDAASTTVQVGLLRTGNAPLWHSSNEESGQSIFTCTEACLRTAGLKLSEIRAFVFCEGPGSMLGVRTVAMAIRTWQSEIPRPAYRYQSLPIAAVGEWAGKEWPNFTLLADARRDTWHCLAVDADCRMQALRRVATADLPADALVTPENFRVWSKLSRPISTCSYDLAKIFPLLDAGDFFHETSAPEAFQHEAPDYKKWSAQTHSAATAPIR